MTGKVQAVYTVVISGNIDGPFKEWEDKVFKKVAREMQLQFGEAARVLRDGQVVVPAAPMARSSHVVPSKLTDASGKEIKRGDEVTDPRWNGDDI